jgi:hypothetical protein
MCYGICLGKIRASSPKSAQAPDLVSPMQAAIARYTVELHATINKHCDSVLQLLKLSATIEPLSVKLLTGLEMEHI